MANKKQQTVCSFGSSLRRAREKREYTREQIAERAGISPVSYTHLDVYKRQVPGYTKASVLMMQGKEMYYLQNQAVFVNSWFRYCSHRLIMLISKLPYFLG